MPELPEVEEVRRTLEPHILNVPIVGVDVRRTDFVSPKAALLQKLVGQRFIQTFRHGKKLFCVADDEQTIVVHLGMSGRVDCVPTTAPVLPHTHVIITLGSGTDVRFRDPRRFGGVTYYSICQAARDTELRNLGKDALEITAADFARWRETRGRLKQRLLSQHDVAGLGNIYVDETLWFAQLHPLQRVDRISPKQIETLVVAMKRILNRSITAGGTTLRDYRNAADQPGVFARELRAYSRGGEPCFRCRNALTTATIAGRTTVYCRACQKRR